MRVDDGVDIGPVAVDGQVEAELAKGLLAARQAVARLVDDEDRCGVDLGLGGGGGRREVAAALALSGAGGEARLPARGDRAQLRRALLNLGRNAVQRSIDL